jgi:hypothetical protein
MIGDKSLRALHSVLHGVRPTVIRPTVVQHIRPPAIHPLDACLGTLRSRLGRCLPYVRVSVCLLRYSANYVFSTCKIIYSYITLRPFLFTFLLIPEVGDFTVGCQIAPETALLGLIQSTVTDIESRENLGANNEAYIP